MAATDASAESKWAPLAALSGVVFVVLLVAGAVLVGAFDYLPAPDKVVADYSENTTRIQAGLYLSMVSVFFLFWFSASLRSHLHVAEGGLARLSNLAFGSGMVGGALMLLSAGAAGAAVQRAGTEAGIDPSAATLAYDLSSTVGGNVFPIALAAMIMASSIVSIRTGVFTRWFGWLGVALAVGLLSPVNWVFLIVAAPWIAAVSIWIYFDARRHAQRV